MADDETLVDVERKLPILGRAVAGALEKLSPADPQRFTFCLFVFDPETQTILHSANHEAQSLYASLSQFLAQHSH